MIFFLWCDSSNSLLIKFFDVALRNRRPLMIWTENGTFEINKQLVTRFLLFPYLDQNVTVHVDFWPVCLLKTEHDENGGEYKCKETAGFIALGFSTRCKPIESWKRTDRGEKSFLQKNYKRDYETTYELKNLRIKIRVKTLSFRDYVAFCEGISLDWCPWDEKKISCSRKIIKFRKNSKVSLIFNK